MEPGAGAAVESQRAGGEPAFGQHNADRKNNAVYASGSGTLGGGGRHIADALGNSDGTVIADILLECCCGKLTGRTRRWLRRGIGVAALAGLLVLGGAFG